MMLDLYIEGDTRVHRASVGLKLALLAAAGGGLFVVKSWLFLLAALAAALGLFVAARAPFRALWAHLRPLVVIIALIFAAQWLLNDLESALAVTLRFVTVLALAILVTLTTRPSDIVAALERGLRPFGRWINVEKVSLAISLALRFLPVLARLAAETREAQWARGQERNIIALATPLVIQTLKMADQIAEALEARGFGAEKERGDAPDASLDNEARPMTR